VWDAARSSTIATTVGRSRSRRGASLALDAAFENAKDCVQTLGGIGFTWSTTRTSTSGAR